MKEGYTYVLAWFPNNRMDPSSSFSTTRRKLQQKNARLNARRRLLFKRRHIERYDMVAHRSRLLAKEARQVRLTLMRVEHMESMHLQQRGHQQNPISIHIMDTLGNVGFGLSNIVPFLRQLLLPYA